MTKIPQWFPKNPPLYDIHKSYEYNAAHGPFFEGSIPERPKSKKPAIDFLGYKVRSPIGVPAGPLLTSKWTALASHLGFDIITYKTIRNREYAGHPHPNIVYIAPENLDGSDNAPLQQTTHQTDSMDSFAITNSFGMPSSGNETLIKDIKAANASLRDGQVLVVSIVGTPTPGEDFTEDFVKTAALARDAGAKIIEANFSCPNVCSGEGSIYTNPDTVEEICSKITKEIGHIPLIIKVGVFENNEFMRDIFLAAARGGARAISGINTIGRKVIDENGKPALGEGRETSGVCGGPIRNHAYDFISKARKIIKEEHLDLTLIGVGGITKPEHFDEMLGRGADVAMSATGMMWDPYLAMRYHEGLASEVGLKPDLIEQVLIASKKEFLIQKLFEIDAIKFGEFTLKSGITSPIYIDLRVIVSYPEILSLVADMMWEKVNDVQFDCVCGVPYTALPIATALSLAHNKPMVMRRKEVKVYGTKQTIEGTFDTGNTCLVVEDLITSGSSVFETVEPLEAEGLRVHDIVVLLDRQHGGRKNIEKRGYTAHAVITMDELLTNLLNADNIDREMYDRVQNFLRENQVTPKKISKPNKTRLSYGDRAMLCTNPSAKRLFNIMEDKKTNLCVAADVTTKYELLTLANMLGPEICLFKTHIDIVEDFDEHLVAELKRFAEIYNFMIFEDRKFADIGNTVKQQYEKGVYHISDWADIVNAHTVPGPGIIDGLREVGMPKGRGLLLLSEMSSSGNLATGSYTEETMKMAGKNKDFVIGFIAMKKQLDDPGFLNMTPGVKLDTGIDNLGQQYNTPEKIIGEHDSDIIIVGRGIYKADNPLLEAKKYREAGWRGYKERIRR
ncbi:MAG: orotate phosphoribosyltransferase [Candidatus Magasanikbacteria bacterium]